MVMTWIIVGAIALVLGSVVLSFNRFVKQRATTANAWANVESELQRRHNLIPNLVETVKAYATHEAATFTEVTNARAGAVAAQGGPEAHVGPENELSGGLRQLLAVSEAYPELRASERFLDLQRELVTTEDRIQASRRLFNANVRDYNQRVETIPSRFIAAMFGFSKSDYFEIESSAAAVPNVRSTD